MKVCLLKLFIFPIKFHSFKGSLKGLPKSPKGSVITKIMVLSGDKFMDCKALMLTQRIQIVVAQHSFVKTPP